MAVLRIQADVIRCDLQYKPKRKYPPKVFLQQSLKDVVRHYRIEGTISFNINVSSLVERCLCLYKQDTPRHTQLRRKLKKYLREVAKKHQIQYQTCFWQFLTFYSTQVSRLLVGKNRALEKDKPTNVFSGPDFKGAFFTTCEIWP